MSYQSITFKNIKTVLFSLLLLFLFSCSDDEGNNNFYATVVGAGMDCGDSYLIKFDDTTIALPKNNSQNVFYGTNLPSQFKVPGLRINVSFRLPTANELMACKTMDFAYPQIFIKKVNNN
jgi:hypothetical protein